MRKVQKYKLQIFIALIIGMFAGVAGAQDDYYNKVNTDTQVKNRIKLIDLGDGTFAMATSAGGIAVSTGSYVLRSAGPILAAPASFTKPGSGLSWLFQVKGGSATFRVNGGDPTHAFNSAPIGDSFGGLSVNPQLDLDFLEAGASVYMSLAMGE